MDDLETALNNLDLTKLQELLAEELILDWEAISRSDLEKSLPRLVMAVKSKLQF